MPQAAHDFFEKELKPTLVDLFGDIYDQIVDGEIWYRIGVEHDVCSYDSEEADRIPNDCEWQDRDGFWSYNNGGVEMDFAPGKDILWGNSSELAPCIKTWVDNCQTEKENDAKDDDDYKAWAKNQENPDVTDWFRDTVEGQDFEERYEDNWMESTPFCGVKAWIQTPGRYQYHGKVTPDTTLRLHFEFCFNDDYGYGRPSISWCPGVGNHPKCEANIFFAVRDVEEVRELINTKIREMASCPDNEVHEKVDFYTKSLDGTAF